MTDNQDAYPDLLAEEFAPVAPRKKEPAPAPVSQPAAEPKLELVTAEKPETVEKEEVPVTGAQKVEKARAPKPQKKASAPKEKAPSLEDLLTPPHQQKLSIMMDEELQGQIEAAVTNLHNSGDFEKYATFADVYRKAFGYFFSGKLKPTEIYRKGPKRRTTLLVNETLAQKLQGINSRVRSRMLEQVLRTFYRRHFNE